MAKENLFLSDIMANKKNINELGWVNKDKDSSKVSSLKNYLEKNNGIPNLETCKPMDIERAKFQFYRDGFVVVTDVLNKAQLDYLRSGCERVIREMMALDKNRVGNRGSHRYSFGGASKTGHLLHHPEWAMLIDLQTVTPILVSIFGSKNYISRGGGGDFCLPGAIEYQALHSDMGDRIEDYNINGDFVSSGSFKDPRGILTYRDLPCPYVCCNFLIVDFNKINGPTRQIIGTQHSKQPIPSLDVEPEWMKLSTVCPAPAGSVLIRDVRAWHGGTPNLSNEIRAIPNVEFYAPWFHEPQKRSVPMDIYKNLSDHGKNVCRFNVVDSNQKIDTGLREDLGYGLQKKN